MTINIKTSANEIAQAALDVLYELQGQKGSPANSEDSPTAQPRVQPGQQEDQQPAASAQSDNAGEESATAAAATTKQRALLTDATRAAAAPQQEVEKASLQLLKTQLNLSFPITNLEQLLEGPRNAKCLRNALIQPGMGSFNGAEALSADCVKEVVSFYDQLTIDSTRDYQLLASCAEVRMH